MDITAIVRNPGIFLVGFIWIAVHGILLFVAGFILKAPLFFICVASQANIGGLLREQICALSTTALPLGPATLAYFDTQSGAS